MHAMDTICDYLSHDHQLCDTLFMQTQASIDRHDWAEGAAGFRRFDNVLRQHIRMEEKVLFPAFLRSMRQADIPISMLHVEHLRIQALLDRMSGALQRLDAVNFFLHAETMTMLLEQHHMKEEEMLYPLLDKILLDRRQAIIRAMCECLEYRAGGVMI